MRRLVIAAVAACLTTTAAHAIDPRHPDWPCAQIMVPSLSVAAFWTGAFDRLDDHLKRNPQQPTEKK